MKAKDLTVLLGIIGIVLMMILPIPSWLLDVLLVINISIALIIILVAMNTKNALEFSIFPSLLLVTTLFRLSLNISTTKLILTYGDAIQWYLLSVAGSLADKLLLDLSCF